MAVQPRAVWAVTAQPGTELVVEGTPGLNFVTEDEDLARQQAAVMVLSERFAEVAVFRATWEQEPFDEAVHARRAFLADQADEDPGFGFAPETAEGE